MSRRLREMDGDTLECITFLHHHPPFRKERERQPLHPTNVPLHHLPPGFDQGWQNSCHRVGRYAVPSKTRAVNYIVCWRRYLCAHANDPSIHPNFMSCTLSLCVLCEFDDSGDPGIESKPIYGLRNIARLPWEIARMNKQTEPQRLQGIKGGGGGEGGLWIEWR